MGLIFLTSILLGVASWLAARATQPALAAPGAQIPIYTPTPGPDGRILYIVKGGETLISISIISGVPVEQIREMNNLTDDTIYEGQTLILGLAGPAETTPTPGPTPTPTTILPTPTPRQGLANLCILLFNDLNGDSVRQEEEQSIPEGAISIALRNGTVNLNHTTSAGLEPHCFNDLPEGEYTIGVAVPPGYNPTTETNYILVLKAGDNTVLDFGAQAKLETITTDLPAATAEKKSPLLAILGSALLLLGLGLGIFARQILKGK
jgi:LysM repeat protein